ncbi:hypothetical protein Tco_1356054 [Tanacetum coccineum]
MLDIFNKYGHAKDVYIAGKRNEDGKRFRYMRSSSINDEEDSSDEEDDERSDGQSDADSEKENDYDSDDIYLSGNDSCNGWESKKNSNRIPNMEKTDVYFQSDDGIEIQSEDGSTSNPRVLVNDKNLLLSHAIPICKKSVTHASPTLNKSTSLSLSQSLNNIEKAASTHGLSLIDRLNRHAPLNSSPNPHTEA